MNPINPPTQLPITVYAVAIVAGDHVLSRIVVVSGRNPLTEQEAIERGKNLAPLPGKFRGAGLSYVHIASD